jgi:hypothetical protein
MDTRTKNKRSFQTAAARRRQDPLIWDIDGHEIIFRASVDLSEVAQVIQILDGDDGEPDTSMAAVVGKRTDAINAMRTFVEKDSLKEFDVIAPDLDLFTLLQDMLPDLIAEYTGMENPTQASPSSDGSSETGNSSTDGAQPEE